MIPGCDRKSRRWRHLDTCQFTIWVDAEVPRIECHTHGGKAGPNSLGGARKPIHRALGAAGHRSPRRVLGGSVTGAAALLQISRDEAWGIKQRVLTPGACLSGRGQGAPPRGG